MVLIWLAGSLVLVPYTSLTNPQPQSPASVVPTVGAQVGVRLSIYAVSPQDLKLRRENLRRQRRWVFNQSLWRSVFVMMVTGGLGWWLVQPDWVIRQGDQIRVEGTEFLTPEAVRGFLELPYPQPLLKLEPHRLESTLKTHGPIAQAQVTRHLFPPGLMIQVQERKPVARAMEPLDERVLSKGRPAPWGYLDAQGQWLAAQSFQQIQWDKLPRLTVMGLRRSQLSAWPTIYQAIQRSRVKVTAINWRDPNNLVLTTELGMVHCGPDPSRLVNQLTILGELRLLPQKVARSSISHIDLSQGDEPILRMKQPLSSKTTEQVEHSVD